MILAPLHVPNVTVGPDTVVLSMAEPLSPGADSVGPVVVITLRLGPRTATSLSLTTEP